MRVVIPPRLINILSLVISIIALAACASIGNPSGGPRDEDPPRFVKANPAPGSTNVKRQRIDIEFDELVNVKDAFTKVVVSPPSAGSVPRVSSQGRRVSVQFNDTLLPNTTYSIDFANAIEDNNEGNKLQGFTYTFSTGETLDSLRISGMVLSADGLEPQQGMLVGVHSNLADSALSTLPFDRVAKTDDRGRFSILGLKPGEYRIYALNDIDNDYKRANPEEAMAFYDFTLSPTSTRVNAVDTIFNLLTGEVDTIINRERTRYLPNDILLRSFESDYKAQFLQKYERVDSTRLSFLFNAPSKQLPELSIVGEDGYKDWYTIERSAGNDTLTYWLRPRSLIAIDSLRIAATYLRTDSAQKLSPTTDTLRFFRPIVKPVKENKKNKKEEEADTLPPVIPPLGIKMITSSNHEVFMPLIMEFDTPLARLDSTAFHLETMQDSVWQPVKGEWKVEPYDTLSPRKLKVEYPWDYATQYRLRVDSLAGEGIYGLFTNPYEHSFKTKTEEDYCAITFNILNFNDSVPAFVELLSTSDAPIRRLPLNGKSVTFRYLTPGKYYARIFEDHNGNGIYDTGDFSVLRQPDMAYYYPKIVSLKKNWEKTEDWNVFDTAIDLMKPEAIKKNKPETDKRARNNKRNDDNLDDEEEEMFDPTRNPFNPNDKGNNRNRNLRR
ncbi:MAG: Ig-like domain-containing protein [Muribaculaceae bacterium]|nr:Ig-like domain-containing protein [Muribaculaceae bacterium]MDE6754528.1 Ig-like domain-containing protein [Muribaculaceae bacterium]